MDLFDLHCDTAYECVTRLDGIDLEEGAWHLSLERGAFLRDWRQVFAVFMPDEYRGEEAVAHYERVRDYLRRQERLFPDRFRIARNAAQWRKCRGGCCAVLSVEGGSALAGNLSRVQSLYDDGVRLITLTWNAANELGDGIRAPEGRGLTAFGKDVVREMNRLCMAVDVSHLSDAGFYDVADCSDAPFVASHSDARALCGNLRNLTDEMIDVIRTRGGLIGLNFYVGFLRDGEDARMTDILRHADYFLSRGCEECLCLGSDFDGCDIPPDMSGIESMETLYGAFLKQGCSEELVRKIFSGNARRYFDHYVFKE